MGVNEIVLLVFGGMAVFLLGVYLPRKLPPQIPPEDLRSATRFELLETKLNGVKSDQRKLGSEWVDYHSKLDTLVRRGIRLGVLDRKAAGDNRGEDDSSQSPAAIPSTRAKILADFRRRDADHKSGA